MIVRKWRPLKVMIEKEMMRRENRVDFQIVREEERYTRAKKK